MIFLVCFQATLDIVYELDYSDSLLSEKITERTIFRIHAKAVAIVSAYVTENCKADH